MVHLPGIARVPHPEPSRPSRCGGNVLIPLVYHSEGYAHLDTARPHLGQVLTYSFVAFVVFVWVPLMIFAALRVHDGPYGIYLILFTLAAFLLPTLIPLGLRLRAKRIRRCGGPPKNLVARSPIVIG